MAINETNFNNNYELSVWTHDDNFLCLLKGSVEFAGQAYEAKFKKNVNGNQELVFNIPLYVFDNINNKFVANHLWSNINNENKIRLISNKKLPSEKIYDFVVKNFEETRDGDNKFATVSCKGYALYELSKIGHNLSFSETTLENEDGSISTANIDFWINKLLPFTRNAYHITNNPDGWNYDVWNYDGNTLYEKEHISGYQKVYDATAGQNIWKPIIDPTPIEKERIIKIEKSNIFNVLQEIAEKFQVWVDFEYTYNSAYKTVGRKIVFKQEVETQGEYVFSYGLNLKGVSRITNTDDIVTKMYVKPIDSEFEDDLLMNIGDAPQNPTGEEFLYNFEYFHNSGLMTTAQYGNYLVLSSALKDKNNEIKPLEANLSNQVKIKDNLLSKRDFVEFQKIGAEQAHANLVNELGLFSPNPISLVDYRVTLVKVSDTYYRASLAYRKGIVSGSFSNFKKHNGTAITPTFNYIYDVEDPSVIVGIYFTSNPDIVTTSVTTDLTTPLTATVASTAGLSVGMTIVNNSANIPVGTTISGISGNTITLSKAAIRAATASTNFTAFRVSFDFSYDPYEFTKKLIVAEQAKIDSFSAQLIDLDTQIVALESNIVSLQESIENKKTDKQNLIESFETSVNFAIKEGEWNEVDYQLRKKLVNLTENNPLPVAHSTSATDSYYITTNLNQIDFTSIQLWKVVNGKYVYQYSRYSDYNIEYGAQGSAEGTKALLFIPTPTGAFASNKLQVSDTRYTQNSTLVIKYKIIGSTNYTQATINRATSYLWNRYFTINTPNLLSHTIKIKPLNSNVEYLKEGIDYSLSTTYVGTVLTTTITLKCSQDAIHLSSYERVTVETNDSLQFFYYDVIDVLNRSAVPNVSYNIGVVDLSSLEGYESFKPDTGQKILINDRELNIVGLYGFVSEIDFDLDNPEDSNVTISNYKTKFEDMFQRIVATTEATRARETTFETLSTMITPKRTLNIDILQNSLAENYLQLSTGSDNSVEWGPQGITLTDLSGDYPVPGQVKIIGNGIFLSYQTDGNGDRIWNSAITGRGINAAALLVGQVDTKKVSIYNSSQMRFSWVAEGLFAYGSDYLGNTDFNTFVRLNEDGLLFQRLTGVNTTETELSLTWDGLTIGLQGNSVKLTSAYGLQVFDDSAQERVQIGQLNGTNNYGIKLKDSVGAVTLETDASGKLWLKNSLTIGNENFSTVGLYGGGATTEEIGIWAGQTFANRASALFRVTYGGVLFATGANISGSITATSGSITGALTVGAGTMKLGADVNSTNDGLYVGATGDYIYDTGAFRFGGVNGISFSGSGNVLIGTGVTISGTIFAEAGSIGGWDIDADEIYKGTGSSKISLNSSLSKITIGVGNYSNTDTSFYVDSTGQFSLKDKLHFSGTTLTINGVVQSALGYFGTAANGISIGATGLSVVGTGTITSGKVIIKNDRVVINNASDVLQVTLGYNGSEYGIFAGDAKLTSSGLTINGTNSSINLGSGAFIVTSAGALTATSATITGTIKATSGYIGGTTSGWSINNSGLIQSTGGTAKISLDAVNGKIYIGTGTYGNDNTPFYADGASQFSLGSKLTYSGGTLTVNGVINATSGNFMNTVTVGSNATKLNIVGTATASTTAIYSTGATYGSSGIWLDASGRFSLGTGLTYNSGTLNITGTIVGSTFKTATNTGNGSTAGVIIDATSARFYSAVSATPITTISTATGILTATSVNLSGSIQSSNYVSGVNGWRIDNAGNAEFENITARGALKSTVFIYDEVNAQGGSLLITQSGVLFGDTVKANSATTLTINVKNTYPSQPYMFEINDTLLIKTYISTTEQIILWLKITSRGSQTGSYTVYNTSVLSSTPTTAYTIPGGTAIVNYGTDTSGFMLMRADDLTNGPYFDIIVNEGTNIHQSTTQKVKTRLGKLTGITDSNFGGALSGYGLYAQNAYLTGSLVLPSAGMTNVGTADTDVRIWAGADFANRATAPFQVQQNGVLRLGTNQMVFDPTSNTITFGSGVSIGFSSITDSPKNYQVEIIGNHIQSGSPSTTLSAVVYQDGLDITSTITDGTKFEWFVGAVSKGTGKTKEILATDVSVSAQIKCVYTP